MASLRKFFLFATFTLPLLFTFQSPIRAQYGTSPSTTVTQKAESSAVSGSIVVNAQLLDALAKALKKSATVQVKVVGTELVDPDTTDGKPKTGQAHIHYKLDNGPIIATTATKLSFHALVPGKHTITVAVAGNDHNLITPETTLTVDIP